MFLRGTPNQLVRSQTDGSGQVTLVDSPGLSPERQLFVSGSTVVYEIRNGQQVTIWQVQTDGTGAQAMGDGLTLDVFDRWVIYLSSGAVYSRTLDGAGPILVTAEPVTYVLHVGARLVFSREDGQLFSILTDGTDRRVLAALDGNSSAWVRPLGSQVVIFRYNPTSGGQRISAVPVTGGNVTTLADEPDYNAFAALVGDRLVYHRCPVLADRVAGPCDVYSVKIDGSGTVALGTQPEYEAVQGVIGSQVIIRRVEGVTDTLYSIPITGGTDTFIRTLFAGLDVFEYVWGVVEDRIILGQFTEPSPIGTLSSIRPNGRDFVLLADKVNHLTQHGGTTGSFACYTGADTLSLWCVPADGSTAPTNVTDDGGFMVGLTP